MAIASLELIKNLTEDSQRHIRIAEEYLELPLFELNYRKEANSWSVLECIEHLNRYFDFYIPAFQQSIKKAEIKAASEFSPGMLGNYFAKLMLPKENFKKMKTFSSMDPIHSALDKTVIEKFIVELKALINILETCKQINLNKVKTSISISKIIKLKMGDALRVVVYHNERHIQQAHRVLENLQAPVV